MDLALNNLHKLICHKTQTTKQHSLGKSYSSAEMQSVYSAVPTDWAIVLGIATK